METDQYLPWLLDESHVMATVIDETGRFERVSREFARRLGRSPDDLVGVPPESLCTERSGRLLRETYRPMLRRTGRLQSVPIEFVAADGAPVHFVASSLRVSDPTGDRYRSLTLFEDFREGAQAMSRLRHVYHLSPTMLHTMDATGRILDVSDQWLRKLGYRRDEVIGRNIRRFLSESTVGQLRDGQLALLRDGLEYNNHPREMVTRESQVIEVLMSARAERDEDGNVALLYVASKDVTERNASERALREALEENSALRRRLELERDYLREEVNVSMNHGHIVGSSDVLRQLLSRIEAVAQTNASVMIVGESGTGKELVARAIHAASARADQPLVKVNCASVPAELFESEFFGHVKGAFTGAHRDRAGRFSLANGGTIFLDEVGEIPLALQGKLLRVLQEKEFERVGDDATLRVDVRVVTATNRDLAADVREGRFREDLFYRLSVFPVEVPPLRSRGDDVVQIATHLLRLICQELGVPVLALSQVQAEKLKAYTWPGNVRELRNRLERAVIMAREGKLSITLPASPQQAADTAVVPSRATILTAAQMRDQERQNIVKALECARWRVSGVDGAAQLLGLKPTTLNGKIKSLGIQRPQPARGRPPRSMAQK